MIPAPDSDAGGTEETRAELRWLLLASAAMILAGVGCWLAYPAATTVYRNWRTHQQLKSVRGHLADQKWGDAAKALREARRIAPEDPDVAHACLDFIQLRGHEPRDTITLVQQLQKTGHATSAEMALMGRMHVRLGEFLKAQAIYDQLPPEARQIRASQELQADLLQSQGQMKPANELRREILRSSGLGDSASLRQFTLLEMRLGTHAQRQALRERLWELARAPGPMCTTALELLAQDKSLSAPEAQELRRLASSLPADTVDLDAVRLHMISAQMRLSPQLRQDLIRQEIEAWRERSPAQTSPLVTWLAAEGEHERILRLVPAALAAKFTDLLPAYVDALRQTKQWAALDDFLTKGGIDPAFPSAQKLLWRTEARAMLEEDPAPPRQMLGRLFEDSGRGENVPLALKTAELAEKLGHWDLAQRCYAALEGKHAAIRPDMLAKVYEMAEHQHDGPAMLAASSRLAALMPDNIVVQEQKLYLQCLLGVELETAALQIGSLRPPGPPARPEHRHLLTALLAHRQSQPEIVREALPKVRDPAMLSAGERAVYAGLLRSAGGDAATIFRILEKIPPGLLLPEERRFSDPGR